MVKWLPDDLVLKDPIKQVLASEETIEYYEKNAEIFVNSTIDVKFEDVQIRFSEFILRGGYILDFGCGSGRDAKAFLDMGYRVEAVDGSEKLCELAPQNIGIAVRKMLFSELDECEKYDGIWACASILHLPKDELKSVFMKRVKGCCFMKGEEAI